MTIEAGSRGFAQMVEDIKRAESATQERESEAEKVDAGNNGGFPSPKKIDTDFSFNLQDFWDAIREEVEEVLCG